MIFAVDIGGTAVKTCLVDDEGRLSDVEPYPFSIEQGAKGLRDPLVEIFSKRGEAAESKGSPIRAVGIGSRGIIDSEGRRLVDDSGSLNFFNGHSFTELLDTDLPIGVENDAVAATMGEILYGVGKRIRKFILLTLGTGIGGGIAIDGKVYKGHTGMAGHLGHFPVNPQGVICGCGNVGCVEREFSARVFRVHIAALNERRGEADKIGDVKHLFDLAREGEPQARMVVRRGVFFLARAISGYANALDPEKIILTGGIAKAGEFLMEMLVEELRPVLWLKDPETFIEFSTLGANMGLYGAGAVGAAQLVD